MSTLVREAIERAGLGPIADARQQRDLAKVRALATALATADLLALGALADEVRKAEVGDEVQIFANVAPRSGVDVVDVYASAGAEVPAGMDLLRAVAIARITGPRAAKVRVDWSRAGLELSQVALGFGASELVGAIASKRGLPIADDAEKKVKGEGMVSVQSLKSRELEALVRRCGRTPVLVTSSVAEGRTRQTDVTTEVPGARAMGGEG